MRDTTNDTRRIILSLVKGVWLSKWHCPTILELFGTDTIATVFTSATPKEIVLDTIKKRNPTYQVIMYKP